LYLYTYCELVLSVVDVDFPQQEIERQIILPSVECAEKNG